MRRLTIALAILLTTHLPALTADDGGVGGFDVVVGQNESAITVEGTRTTRGSAPAPAPGPAPERAHQDPHSPPADADPESGPWGAQQVERCFRTQGLGFGCVRRALHDRQPDEPTAPIIPVATVSDVAEFTPAGVGVTAEPQNVAVVGLPANFIAPVSVQTVTGSLFGLPVSVRFSPAAYDYVFGDGEVATVAAPGKSWADLGQAQFTPTPTSHIYKARGTFPARVDVRYTAEVDFGTGWYTVDGEVTSPGAPQPIRVLEASTVLVAHTCTQRPAAPGC